MGAEVVAWDDGTAARKTAAVAGVTVAMPAVDTCDALILSPGIPHRLPHPHPLALAAQKAGVPIRSDADFLYQAVRKSGSRAKFAGITGTNGKSTTTALLAHILSVAGRPVAAGGNLGTAALALPYLDTPDAVYVLEMSSYMLERLASIRFDAAAMLNLSPDHIDRHGDMAGYARAKRAIFDRQTGADTAVVGVDDALSRDMAASLRAGPGRLVTISGEGRADVWSDGTRLRDAADSITEGPIADLSPARALPGAHNAQNAAAAAALALALGVARADIAAGMASYPGLAHRQEQVAAAGGVLFINDSKATNADSAARALGCYDRVVWIAGGTAKAGGIDSLVPFFPRIALALLIGRDAPVLAATLAAHGVPYRDVGTLEVAVAEAWRAARGGAAPVVLLSPACASWDQFTGFDQRGDRFRALALALAGAA
jgi:UDP-N-acetylmuramoylalanine--D-glutamate ligase